MKKVTKANPKKTDLPKTAWPAAHEETAPTTRTMVEVQQEYSQLCAQAGDLHFRVVCTERDLSNLNAKLFQLNQEAAMLTAQSQAKASTASSLSPEVEAPAN